MTTATKPQPTTAQQTIAARTVCLCLEIGIFGNRSKVDPNHLRARKGVDEEAGAQVDLDGAAMLHISKDLLRSDELVAINKLDVATRNWIRSHTLPSLFKDGVYLLPLDLLPMADVRLAEYEAQRTELIEAFLVAYPARIEEARAHLGENFDQADYPSAQAIRSRFKVRYRYVEVQAPGKREGITSDIYRREQAKAREEWERVATACKAMLRAELQEAVRHLIHRLTPTSDGKKKIIRETLVPNFAETLELIAARDVTDDGALRRLVTKAEAMVAGVDSDALREFPTERARVLTAAEELKPLIDKLVEDAPRYIEMAD